MKKLFGLFEDASATQRAVSNLVPTLIPESNLQLVSDDPTAFGEVTRRPRLAPLAQLGEHAVRIVESNQPPASQLRDLGLPAHSLPSFSHYVKEGSVVLVIDTDDDSAESIASLIREMDGLVS